MVDQLLAAAAKCVKAIPSRKVVREYALMASFFEHHFAKKFGAALEVFNVGADESSVQCG